MSLLWLPPGVSEDDERMHWEQAAGSGEFVPTELSAVSAWLRLAGGTITGAGYSSVPDLLASNPATQGTDANRPPNLNSANGLPRADFDGATDFLSWPVASNNNQTVTHGFAAWVETDSVAAGQTGIFCFASGVASAKYELTRNNDDLLVDVHHSQFVARRGTIADTLVAGTKYFITFEFNGAEATDDLKCTITLNGVVQTLAFSDGAGTPGAMPATLVSAAGPYLIGVRTTAPVGPFNGKIGPNIFILGSKMAGATQGLLTTGARTALMNFERPT